MWIPNQSYHGMIFWTFFNCSSSLLLLSHSLSIAHLSSCRNTHLRKYALALSSTRAELIMSSQVRLLHIETQLQFSISRDSHCADTRWRSNSRSLSNKLYQNMLIRDIMAVVNFKNPDPGDQRDKATTLCNLCGIELRNYLCCHLPTFNLWPVDFQLSLSCRLCWIKPHWLKLIHPKLLCSWSSSEVRTFHEEAPLLIIWHPSHKLTLSSPFSYFHLYMVWGTSLSL